MRLIERVGDGAGERLGPLVQPTQALVEMAGGLAVLVAVQTVSTALGTALAVAAHGNILVIVIGVIIIFVTFSAIGAISEVLRQIRELRGDSGSSARKWNLPGVSGVLPGRAGGHGASPAVSGLMTGAGWRMMRAAAWLMPRAAGRRWLAEAASFLFEASPGQRRRAVRSYLLTAPRVIAKSWAGHLIRRIRPH
jgi:hypothetical protein